MFGCTEEIDTGRWTSDTDVPGVAMVRGVLFIVTGEALPNVEGDFGGRKTSECNDVWLWASDLLEVTESFLWDSAIFSCCRLTWLELLGESGNFNVSSSFNKFVSWNGERNKNKSFQ